jgi:hypothetical protein
MKPEEELVLKVLRVTIAAAFLTALAWMVYKG